MEKPDFSYKELVNEQIFSFIRKVKSKGILPEGMTYLALLASQGSDKKFALDDRDIAEYIEKKGQSFGFVREENDSYGKVQTSTQKHLRNFFSDKSNVAFVLKGENDPYTRRSIENLFGKAEKSTNFIDEHGTALSSDASKEREAEREIEREKFYKKAMEDKLLRFIINNKTTSPMAIRYLASLAIKGEVVVEAVGMPVSDSKVRGVSPKNPYLKNTEFISKLNEKAQAMGIVSITDNNVSVSPEMQKHLTNFLLGDAANTIESLNDIGRNTYDEVKRKLDEYQSRRNNIRY